MATYLGRFQILAKPATEWGAANPVLLNGELGVAEPGSSAPVLKVGDGVRPWSALPQISGAGGGGSPDYVVGSTTTLAPGSFATVNINNSVSPPTISFGIPTGAAGPPNTLAMGIVTTGAPGTPASATITGAAPNQTLSLTIPKGEKGDQGEPGADGATGPPGPGGGAVYGDPTGVIGLVAVPGVAVTGMRSDAAPALSQAIAPTWTALHTFKGGNAPVTLENANIPRLHLLKSGTLNWYVGGDGTASNDFAIYLNAAQALRVNTSLQLLAASGTAALPAFAFDADQDTGMYRLGPDRIGFATGGAVHLALGLAAGVNVLSADVPIWLQDGTDAAPSYSFTNDQDTGIYRSGPNSMRFSAGGAPFAGISPNGGFFAIDGVSGSAASPYLYFANDNDTGMYRYAENHGALTAGGVATFLWSPTRLYARAAILGADGNSATPSYTFENDVDTGLCRAGENQIGVTLGGAMNAGFGIAFGSGYGSIAARAPSTSAYAANLQAAGTALSGGANSCLRLVSSVGGAAVNLVFTDGATWNSWIEADNVGNLLFSASGGGAWGERFRIATSGAISASGGITAASFNASSSRALKRETGRVTRAADILARLRPILYRLIDNDDAEQLGLIAEEVHEVCPQLSNGKSVSYDRLALLLLADWQESRACA